MKAEIITIGDEILIGQIIDTNSAYIAQQLNLIGVAVYQITSVSDNKQHIIDALNEAHQRADIILITGGLGPTADDITKPTLLEFFGGKMIQNNDVLEDIKRYLAGRSRTLNERNIKQAEVPDSCTVIRNPVGTAPCMWFEKNKVITVSMPGVPFEMKELMKQVLPLISKRIPQIYIQHKTFITFGLGESAMAELIADWENALPSFIKLAYLPSPEGLRLRLSGKHNNEEELAKIIEVESAALENIISKYIYSHKDGEYLPMVTGRMLHEQNATLATAESCTGGNIAHQLTLIPGSSRYFLGSVVAYSNEIKMNFLGVEKEALEQYGAVSKLVVEQMAEGVRKKMGTTYGLATSGIAGPDGGTPEKPVGTVWYALAWEGGVESRSYQFNITREVNIRMATTNALNLLRMKLQGIL